MRSGDGHVHHQPAGHIGHGRAASIAGQHRDHRAHHTHMVADFRRRFWFSLALSVPVLALAPLIQRWLGLETAPGYLKEHRLDVTEPRAAEVAEQGKTVVYVLVDDRPAGAIALADVIRQESREALGALKRMGIQVMMLTGDARAVAEWVARELGLDDFFAEVLPDQKAAKIREVKGRGLRVAMTGDGVNDAPALIEADIGIAIGAGTDVAIEAADVVLVRSDPRDVVAIVSLARATYRKMVQNLWWATGYNVVAIPLAAGALASQGIVLTPAVGALLMSLSTVIVAINARFLRLPDATSTAERRYL